MPSIPEALAHARTLSPALAKAQAAAILQAVPEHPEALLLLGTAQRLCGDLAAARATLEPLARAQGRAASVQMQWGLTQAALGELGLAVASLRTAAALKPDMAGIWLHLGEVLARAGEPAAAEAAYARHVEEAVHDPALMRAAAEMQAERLQEAEHLLRAHLARFPTDVAALRMLAEIGTRFGRDADAERILGECLALLPGFALARYNLALVLFRQNRAREALPHLEILSAADARNPNYRNLQAACLALVGRFQQASDLYESLLDELSYQPKMWLSWGHVLRSLGAREKSLHAYRMAIAQAPEMGEAYWSIANFKNALPTPLEIDAMRAQLARSELGVEDRLHFHFALGHALEQQGAFAQSWFHYAQGAQLRRGQITYSADDTSAQLARTRALMTADFFAARAGFGCKDAAPIFIVGLPRSGSTLIEQILASHSQVEGTQELPELARLARALGARETSADTYPDLLRELGAADCQRLGEQFLEETRIYRKLGRPFYIDKMPNNFVHVGLIHLILPRAKIIDARRHPIAACFSAFKQHFAKGQHFSYDLADLARYYTDYLALMTHFETALPGRVHLLRYESMVDDTEAETRALLAYCGLAFEPGCLRFHENTRPVRTASSEQVRRPIFRDGLDHWRHYEPWLGKLKEGLAF